MSTTNLISPRPAASTPREPAPRWDGMTGKVTLSDSMISANAGWGSGILRTVAATFVLSSASLTIEEVRRPQIGEHRPHEWVEHLHQGGVDALVVTAGDCATCTSRAIRECVLAESVGIASTAVVPVALTDICDATLSAWGRADLEIAYLDEPLFRWRPETIVANVEPAAQRAWHILTGSPRSASQTR